MSNRPDGTRFALAISAFIVGGALIAGCSGGGASSGATTTAPGVSQVSIGGACTPAPLPSPGVMLINPAPNATGVSRAIGTITFQVDTGAVQTTATMLSLVPTIGSVIGTTQITVRGTPSPVNGITVFNASLGATLAANTTYAVSVSGRQADGCNDPYSSPAGSFTTGS